MKKYTSIELFAGAGGLALGLEEAGFQHLGLIEKDKDAVATLKFNRPNWPVYAEDITGFVDKDLEEVFSIKKGNLDLLSGGAPCQSFSTAGKKLGLEDTRGTMFYYYAMFLDKLQPKVFLFENVRGLKTHDKKRTFQVILDVFQEAGYTVKYEVLNAWDYGAPQKRERLITIGIRNDIAKNHEYIYPTPHIYKPVIRDIELEDHPDKTRCSYYSENKYKVISQVPPGGCWSDIPEEIAKPYMKGCWFLQRSKPGILRRFKLDEPCYAVMTSPSSKYCDRCHPIEVRPFSIRENARLQTFPDEWEFLGSVTSQYRQVGNAVPVSLAKDIGLQIARLLGELDE